MSARERAREGAGAPKELRRRPHPQWCHNRCSCDSPVPRDPPKGTLLARGVKWCARCGFLIPSLSPEEPSDEAIEQVIAAIGREADECDRMSEWSDRKEKYGPQLKEKAKAWRLAATRLRQRGGDKSEISSWPRPPKNPPIAHPSPEPEGERIEELRKIVDAVFLFLNSYAKDPHNMGKDPRSTSSISPHAIIAEVYAMLAPAHAILHPSNSEEEG